MSVAAVLWRVIAALSLSLAIAPAALAQDTTPPTVTGVSPLDGAIDVPVAPFQIIVNFSEAMDISTLLGGGAVFVEDETGTFHKNANWWEVQQRQVRILSTDPYQPGTTYFVYVTTDATDAAGNHLEEEFVSSFTTADVVDTTPPTVTGVSPLDGAIDVPVAPFQIIVNFSEAMDISTLLGGGAVFVEDETGTFHKNANWWEVQQRQVRILSTDPYQPGTTYFVYVTTDATDAAGNHLEEEFVSSFTTADVVDTTPPTVTGVSPLDGAIDVPVAPFQIIVNFSEAMDISTLLGGGAVFVEDETGTFHKNANWWEVQQRQVRILSTSPFESDTTYFVHVTTDATDAAGNHLEEEFVSSFTTEAIPADIEVSPVVVDFGDVNLGIGSPQIVTISNLGDLNLVVNAIDFEGGLGGDFSITAAPVLPATILPDETADVEITFAPTVLGAASAILQITSNDPDQPLVEVVMTGEGVTLDPSDALGTILEFFDQSVMDGTLVGSGPGGSGPGRLNALRNMLEAAGDLIDAGLTEDACNQLLDALLRTDGVFPPPDFVAGTAAPELATQIQDLRTTLGCDVQCGDVNRGGDLGPEDTDRARDYLVRLTPEPPFELARCSVSGEERACHVGDVARMRRWTNGLPVTLQNGCLTAILDPGSP